MYKLDLEKEKIIIDNVEYKLIDKNTKGGNGIIYRIKNYKSDVVLKVLNCNNSTEKLKRFKREVEYLKNLKNINRIPSIHMDQIDKDGKDNSYIMDYYKPVVNQLKLFYDMDDNLKIKHLKNLVELIYILHKMGIYHRDIKIANLLFDEYEGFILCDFGIIFVEDDMSLTINDNFAPGNKIIPESLRREFRKYEDRSNYWKFDIYLLGNIIWQIMNNSREHFKEDRYDSLNRNHNTIFFTTKNKNKNVYNDGIMNLLLEKSINCNEEDRYKSDNLLREMENLYSDSKSYYFDESYTREIYEIISKSYSDLEIKINRRRQEKDYFKFEFSESGLLVSDYNLDFDFDIEKNQKINIEGKNQIANLFKLNNTNESIEINFLLKRGQNNSSIDEYYKLKCRKNEQTNNIINKLINE